MEQDYDDTIFYAIDIRTDGTKRAFEIQSNILKNAFENLVFYFYIQKLFRITSIQMLMLK